jgi:hypothetical protein
MPAQHSDPNHLNMEFFRLYGLYSWTVDHLSFLSRLEDVAITGLLLGINQQIIIMQEQPVANIFNMRPVK